MQRIKHKTKHVEGEKKLNENITSYTKTGNGLSGEIKLISIKRLTKDLISGCSIINGTKHFVEDRSQNYLFCSPLLKYFQVSRTPLNPKAMAWKFTVCQMKVLDPLLRQIIVLIQPLGYFNNANFRIKFNGSCLKSDRVSSSF